MKKLGSIDLYTVLALAYFIASGLLLVLSVYGYKSLALVPMLVYIAITATFLLIDWSGMIK